MAARGFLECAQTTNATVTNDTQHEHDSEDTQQAAADKIQTQIGFKLWCTKYVRSTNNGYKA